MEDMLFDRFRKTARMLAPVAQAFERRLNQYGDDPRAVFWKSGGNQLLRFETLYRIFDDVDEAGGLTINDFGCGYGAFFDFLADKPPLRRGRYIGYDMSKKMIEEAKQRTIDPRARFIQHITVTEPGDFTFACGTFNMHLRANEDDWDRLIKDSLRQLWSKTRKGLAFNLLRSDSIERCPGLFYINGADYLEFCRRELSPGAVMEEDPLLPDYTFFVRRERWSSAR